MHGIISSIAMHLNMNAINVVTSEHFMLNVSFSSQGTRKPSHGLGHAVFQMCSSARFTPCDNDSIHHAFVPLGFKPPFSQCQAWSCCYHRHRPHMSTICSPRKVFLTTFYERFTEPNNTRAKLTGYYPKHLMAACRSTLIHIRLIKLTVPWI